MDREVGKGRVESFKCSDSQGGDSKGGASKGSERKGKGAKGKDSKGGRSLRKGLERMERMRGVVIHLRQQERKTGDHRTAEMGMSTSNTGVAEMTGRGSTGDDVRREIARWEK